MLIAWNGDGEGDRDGKDGKGRKKDECGGTGLIWLICHHRRSSHTTFKTYPSLQHRAMLHGNVERNSPYS